MSDYRRPDPIQEPDHVSGRSAVKWWVGTVLAVAACTAISFAALQVAAPGRQKAFPPPQGRIGVVGPRHPYTRATHTAGPDSATRLRMESYRWVDRDARVAAVPIEEAMRLLTALDRGADSAAAAVAADSVPADSTGTRR